MFSKLSHPGIVFENIRSMSFSIMAYSLVMPLIRLDFITILFGILVGCYYGYMLEKHTHELRSLGGRVMKGKSWDYLVLA